METPRIDKAAWTFSLSGNCTFCDKRVTRSRTYHAKSTEDAQAQADATLAAGIWHKKCGLV